MCITSQVLHVIDMRDNFISDEGRLTVASMLCPEAPSVKAALEAEKATKMAQRARYHPHAADEAAAAAKAKDLAGDDDDADDDADADADAGDDADADAAKDTGRMHHITNAHTYTHAYLQPQ